MEFNNLNKEHIPSLKSDLSRDRATLHAMALCLRKWRMAQGRPISLRGGEKTGDCRGKEEGNKTTKR